MKKKERIDMKEVLKKKDMDIVTCLHSVHEDIMRGFSSVLRKRQLRKERFDLNAVISVSSEDIDSLISGNALAENISMTGIKLLTDLALEEGNNVTVALNHPEGDVLMLKGTVCRISKEGYIRHKNIFDVGIRFKSMGYEEKRRLTRLLMYALEKMQ